jgi:hypothetical protein
MPTVEPRDLLQVPSQRSPLPCCAPRPCLITLSLLPAACVGWPCRCARATLCHSSQPCHVFSGTRQSPTMDGQRCSAAHACATAPPWPAMPRHARCVKLAINLLSIVCRRLPYRPSCRECVLTGASLQPLVACLAMLRFMSPFINPLLLYSAL